MMFACIQKQQLMPLTTKEVAAGPPQRAGVCALLQGVSVLQAAVSVLQAAVLQLV